MMQALRWVFMPSTGEGLLVDDLDFSEAAQTVHFSP
jgi:hypothetical protein